MSLFFSADVHNRSFIVGVSKQHLVFWLFISLFITSLIVSAETVPETIEEVIVTADFRKTTLLSTAASISVIDSETIIRRQAKHLEQVLNVAPNVNFASGASRGRFIQIRGIGERSQFIEPLNPSVGILIDGIDFSGIAGGATTMDVNQIEILRGPQGTILGANALAGLISISANQPNETLQGNLSLGAGSYNTHTLAAAMGGPLTRSINYRVAAQAHKSDGYISNQFLNREDTDNIDELSLRGIFQGTLGGSLALNLTVFHVNAVNGYDAFSLDNNRQTLSDKPGRDYQRSNAFSLKSEWQANDLFEVIGLISYADSDTEYGYDEDWANPAICAGKACDGWEYNSEDSYSRDRQNSTFDLRFVSKQPVSLIGRTTDWVLGVYAHEQDEDLLRQYTYNSQDFTSVFDTSNKAIYGQLDTVLSANWVLASGIRFENRRAQYQDSDFVDHTVDENLWGGKVALQYSLGLNSMVYGLVSRGYKAGGVNSDSSLSAEDRAFDTEFMWNIETGTKGMWLDKRIQAQISAFYQQRKDIQIKQSLVQSRDDSNASDFTDYFGNSARGHNYGVEMTLNWVATDAVTLVSSVGWLQTEYDTPASEALDRRRQAHAPSYQFALGFSMQITQQLALSMEVEGKDSFYLSSSHNEKTQPYELLNLNLDYSVDNWHVSVWGRNLTDEDVIVRGFGGFGNDPRKYYVVEPYYQFGEPRMFGINTQYTF
ncbi:MAG: TonB-dependent receptor [Porticoccaceae bacterium]|nr:TonB-dependent receptor [Porticoccaceae bacterium]